MSSPTLALPVLSQPQLDFLPERLFLSAPSVLDFFPKSPRIPARPLTMESDYDAASPPTTSISLTCDETQSIQRYTNLRKMTQIPRSRPMVSSPFLMAAHGKGMRWRGTEEGYIAQELRRKADARRKEWKMMHQENEEKRRWEMWGTRHVDAEED